MKIESIQEKINKKMKFLSGTDLLLFKETKNRNIGLEQLAHEQLLNGDICVFQIDEKEKLNAFKLPKVLGYFQFVNFFIFLNLFLTI